MSDSPHCRIKEIEIPLSFLFLEEPHSSVSSGFFEAAKESKMYLGGCIDSDHDHLSTHDSTLDIGRENQVGTSLDSCRSSSRTATILSEVNRFP